MLRTVVVTPGVLGAEISSQAQRRCGRDGGRGTRGTAASRRGRRGRRSVAPQLRTRPQWPLGSLPCSGIHGVKVSTRLFPAGGRKVPRAGWRRLSSGRWATGPEHLSATASRRPFAELRHPGLSEDPGHPAAPGRCVSRLGSDGPAQEQPRRKQLALDQIMGICFPGH